MSAVALRVPGGGAWRRLAEAVLLFVRAMGEGFAAARRYERLSTLSDAQLERLGITRQDLGWFAMYGRPRPR